MSNEQTSKELRISHNHESNSSKTSYTLSGGPTSSPPTTIANQQLQSIGSASDLKKNQKNVSSWTKVFDPSSQSNYYWNEETDETTWDIPDGFPVEGCEGVQVQEESNNTSLEISLDPSKKLDDAYFQSKEYHDWYYTQYYPSLYANASALKESSGFESREEKEKFLVPEYKDYSASAYFNSKTGKFKNVEFDPRFKPDTHFSQEEKGTRQMSNFFDIARHNEEITFAKRRKNADAPLKLTKKELEGFKKKKMDKKRMNLKAKYTD